MVETVSNHCGKINKTTVSFANQQTILNVTNALFLENLDALKEEWQLIALCSMQKPSFHLKRNRPILFGINIIIWSRRLAVSSLRFSESNVETWTTYR